MKKALIIGAAGFVGGYLIQELSTICEMEIYATKLPNEQLETDLAKVYNLDILNIEEITSLLYDTRPDYIFHLAAQSSVGLSWKNPCLTVDVNVKGCLNVLDAVRKLSYKPRILLIGSGEEYGYIMPDELPIVEDTLLRPGNIYAVTKVCQNMIGNIYSRAYDMELIMVRAFNHVGPRQSPTFVVSDFCKQVAEIEKGLIEPVIKVGNLEAKRDFTDVRDVVKAYVKLILSGESGETYNVGCGHAYTIREILNIIVSESKVNIKIVVDPNKVRPIDIPIIEADISKIKAITGWVPRVPIRQTICESLDYWRRNV